MKLEKEEGEPREERELLVELQILWWVGPDGKCFLCSRLFSLSEYRVHGVGQFGQFK